MKQIVIIGGGITGLSLAWYLRGKAHVTLIEASGRLGGWIETKVKDDFLYECGPRSFRGMMPLIQELGLENKVIEAHATTKYLAYQGRLEEVPSSMSSFFTTRLGRKCLQGVLSYPFRKKKKEDDESVASYFKKRFGQDFVDTFIDPICAGIYAASPYSLSKKASFRKRSRSSKGIFSFQEGMETLPKKLASCIDADLLLHTKVTNFKEYSDCVEVECGGKIIACDELFVTSPIKGGTPIPEVMKNSVVTISLGYKNFKMALHGFGFLASSKEENELLGIIFDSAVFPEHNGPYATRLSVMMGGERAPELLLRDDSVLKMMAEGYARKYLGVGEGADAIEVTRCSDAIYGYPVGHMERVERMQESGSRRVKRVGAYIGGVSIPDCVEQARGAAGRV